MEFYLGRHQTLKENLNTVGMGRVVEGGGSKNHKKDLISRHTFSKKWDKSLCL